MGHDNEKGLCLPAPYFTYQQSGSLAIEENGFSWPCAYNMLLRTSFLKEEEGKIQSLK